MLGGSADENEIQKDLDEEIRRQFGVSPERVDTTAMAGRLIARRENARRALTDQARVVPETGTPKYCHTWA